MRKIFTILIACLFFDSVSIYNVYANPHWNAQATVMAQDDGDSLRTFSVTVGTTTPTLVYTSTQTAAPARTGYPGPDRRLVIQNIQNYQLFCSTYSTVKATSGNRFLIQASSQPWSQWDVRPATGPIYCIFASAAGGTSLEILGYVYFDSGD